MKCQNCGNEIIMQVAQKLNSKGCNIVTNPTTVITIQCSKCKKVFQVSTSTKSIISIKKNDN